MTRWVRVGGTMHSSDTPKTSLSQGHNSLMDESEGLLITVAMSISNPSSDTLSMFETRLDRFPDNPCSGVGHVFTLGGRLLSRCLSHFHPTLMEGVRVAAGVPLFLSTLRASEICRLHDYLDATKGNPVS
jgi:hypothetical protein